MVIACGGALVLGVRLVRIRSTQAALVGGMLGPLFVVATVCPALAGTETVWTRLAAVLGGGLLLALVSVTGAEVARRLEGDRGASAGLSWTGASLLLAGLAWILYGERTGAAWLAQASIPMGAGVAGAGVAAFGLLGGARGRLRPPRTHLGGLLFVSVVAAAAAPFWPAWFPWLLYDRNLPQVDSWPPNLLFVALEPPGTPQRADSAPVVELLEVLAVDGVSYADLSPEPEVGSLFALPDGSLLVAHLRDAGYATAAIGPVPERLRELGVAEIDDRPGGRRLLERSAAWMAAAPLLLGPGSGLLGLLGHDRPLRSPEQVGDEAARWILGWRTRRAPAPFFLFVDLRTPAAGVEAIDAGLQRILDRLEGLELDSVTILVIAVERGAAGASAPSLRALVVPPSTWPRAPRLDAPAQVWARAVSQSLLQIALSDGRHPVRLAGLDQEFSPPKLP